MTKSIIQHSPTSRTKRKPLTRLALLCVLYSSQKHASRERQMPLPTYSKQWFIDRYLEDVRFCRLYDEWVKSGCQKQKRPSIDRINRKKSYTPDNINLMTWAENRYKQRMELRIQADGGPVVQMKNGRTIKTFASQAIAARRTGIGQSQISAVLKGKRISTGGYQWAHSVEEGLQKPTAPPQRNAIGFRGLHKTGRRYTASFQYKGVREWLGAFNTPEEAAQAYDRKAYAVLGDNATLNFPDEHTITIRAAIREKLERDSEKGEK